MPRLGHILRIWVALTLALQTTIVQAVHPRVDLDQILCTPSGAIASSEARLAMAELIDLLEIDPEPEPLDDGHCIDCLLAKVMILPDTGKTLAIRYAMASNVSVRPVPLTGRIIRGPPVGSTAPPLRV